MQSTRKERVRSRFPKEEAGTSRRLCGLRIAVLVLALVLAGTATTWPQDTRVPIKVGIIPGIIDVPVLLMEAMGLPAKYGVKLDIRRFGDPGTLNDAWLHREIQIQPGINVLQSSAHHLKTGYGLAVFSSFLAPNKVVVKSASPITQLKDLKGKRLGIPSRLSGESLVLGWLLGEVGVSWQKDVDVREIPPGVLPGMVQRDQIDAMVLFEPLSSVALTTGPNRVALDIQKEWQRRQGFPLMFSAIHVDDRFARENGEVLRAYLRMYREAALQIPKDPDRAFAHYKTALKLSERSFEVLKENMKNIYPVEWNEKTIREMHEYLKLGVRLGLIEKVPEGMFTLEYAPRP